MTATRATPPRSSSGTNVRPIAADVPSKRKNEADTAAIGTQVDCTVRVEALSNVPTASVNRTVPAQFVNATLTPDADPGNWDCTALTSCDYTANGGTLQPGVYTFTATADVVAPPGDVQDCTDVATAGTTLNSAAPACACSMTTPTRSSTSKR